MDKEARREKKIGTQICLHHETYVMAELDAVLGIRYAFLGILVRMRLVNQFLQYYSLA